MLPVNLSVLSPRSPVLERSGRGASAAAGAHGCAEGALVELLGFCWEGLGVAAPFGTCVRCSVTVFLLVKHASYAPPRKQWRRRVAVETREQPRERPVGARRAAGGNGRREGPPGGALPPR